MSLSKQRQNPIVMKIPIDLADVVILTRTEDIPINTNGTLTAVEIRPVTTTPDVYIRVRLNYRTEGTSITLIEGYLKEGFSLTWVDELQVTTETQFTVRHLNGTGAVNTIRLSAVIELPEGK